MYGRGFEPPFGRIPELGEPSHVSLLDSEGPSPCDLTFTVLGYELPCREGE